MRGAQAAGCQFDNLERWSRFFRARASVQLVMRRMGDDDEFITIHSRQNVDQLALLLPPAVVAAQQPATGHYLPLRTWQLEGRSQHGIVVDMLAD